MSLQRRVRTKAKSAALFEDGTWWEDAWWGMPEFSMGDASPSHRVTINFMSSDDLKEFSNLTGIPLTTRSDTAWFPHQKPLSGQFEYDGPKTDSKYPICIPSKGRADCQKTGKALDRMGVSYKFFVEETEGDKYKESVGESNVVVMPFHDLGQGSIPKKLYLGMG